MDKYVHPTFCNGCFVAWPYQCNRRNSAWLLNSDANHCDVIKIVMASQIFNLTIVYSTVYSGVDQGKHESSASLAFVRGIHRWPVNSPHKGPVTRTILPFHDVVMHSSSGFHSYCAWGAEMESREIRNSLMQKGERRGWKLGLTWIIKL